MTNCIIKLYEGSYLYNEIEVELVAETNLFTGVLNELNRQFNYRPSAFGTLWSTIVIDDKELYRITRLSNGLAKIRSFYDFDKPFNFLPLVSYSLTKVEHCN